MISYYLVLFIILITFGLFNLTWRVRNDSVIYFYYGSTIRIAPGWIIFLTAAAGLFLGVFFSRDMLGIVRTGIFQPQVFVFSEIMVLFTAMIIADVILMNVFRTLVLPSSNIIMVLFELLGSSIAVSMVRIRSMRVSVSELILFINTNNVLRIIAAILISVIIAFFLGALVQYLIRFLFTFRYRRLFKWVGFFYGAVLITFAFRMILVGGLEGSVLKDLDDRSLIIISLLKQNAWLVWVIGLPVVSLFLWGLSKFFRFRILNMVILSGIFFLAFSISANDLVNLAGVPLAGYESFSTWISTGGTTAETFRMNFLGDYKGVPLLLLAITGLILILVLFTSRKGVKKPESIFQYGLREEGEEGSLSIYMARSLIRSAIAANNLLREITPRNIKTIIRKRFDNTAGEPGGDQQVFTTDKIRISVNLFVAGTLIAVVTSMELPVSTTYVAFMVMLGSSLADRAWGRESAVFRISGFFNVMGSWLLTAVIAFVVSALLAWIIIVGGIVASTGLIVFTAFIIIRSQVILHRRGRTAEEEDLISDKDEIEKSIEKCNKQVVETIISVNKIFSFTLDSFIGKNRSQMHQTMLLNNEFNRMSLKQKNKIIQTIPAINRIDVNSGYFYIQVFEYQREIAHSLNQLTAPLNEHLENQHKPFGDAQINDIRLLAGEVDTFFNFALHIVKEEKLEAITEWLLLRVNVSDTLAEIEKGLLSRMKNKEVDVRSALLLFKALGEIKNLLGHTVSMIKAYRDFVLVSRKST